MREKRERERERKEKILKTNLKFSKEKNPIMKRTCFVWNIKKGFWAIEELETKKIKT